MQANQCRQKCFCSVTNLLKVKKWQRVKDGGGGFKLVVTHLVVWASSRSFITMRLVSPIFRTSPRTVVRSLLPSATQKADVSQGSADSKTVPCLMTAVSCPKELECHRPAECQCRKWQQIQERLSLKGSRAKSLTSGKECKRGIDPAVDVGVGEAQLLCVVCIGCSSLGAITTSEVRCC